MKIAALFIFLFCLNSAWASQPTQTTLPLEFNTGNPAPYGMASAIITIEGKALPIIVDTGAKKYGLALTKEALKKIHVQFTGKFICSNSLTGKHCEKEFIVPEVKLGSFTIKNVIRRQFISTITQNTKVRLSDCIISL